MIGTEGETNFVSPETTDIPSIVKLKSSTVGGVASPRPGATSLISVIVVGMNVLVMVHVSELPIAVMMFPLTSQSPLNAAE